MAAFNSRTKHQLCTEKNTIPGWHISSNNKNLKRYDGWMLNHHATEPYHKPKKLWSSGELEIISWSQTSINPAGKLYIMCHKYVKLYCWWIFIFNYDDNLKNCRFSWVPLKQAMVFEFLSAFRLQYTIIWLDRTLRGHLKSF